MNNKNENNNNIKNIENQIFHSRGLKGTWKRKHGMNFFRRIKAQIKDIKLAWQRVWYGWDDCCAWNINSAMTEYLIKWLEKYKKNRIGIWVCPEEYENIGKYDEQYNTYNLTDEQINAILDTLIFHLKMSNEDYCEKVVTGQCIYDEDYKFDAKKDYNRLEKIRKQNQNAAMDLLKIWMDQLWD